MTKPACYNAPRPTTESGYWVKTRRYMSNGMWHWQDEFIPYRFSTECHHDGIYADCTGCEWRKK